MPRFKRQFNLIDSAPGAAKRNLGYVAPPIFLAAQRRHGFTANGVTSKPKEKERAKMPAVLSQTNSITSAYFFKRSKNTFRNFATFGATIAEQ
jgi:hypothetical protein